jgi:hypothetical protein
VKNLNEAAVGAVYDRALFERVVRNPYSEIRIRPAYFFSPIP